MSSAPSRVFVARLAGTAVFDPLGDKVGRIRDIVAVSATEEPAPRAVGMIVEVPGRRRVFLPMTRITSIDAGHVITTGLVNLRRFEQRPNETRLLAELLDRRVRLESTGESVTIEDVAISPDRLRQWWVSKLFIRRPRTARLRRGETIMVDYAEVDFGGRSQQGTATLLARLEQLKAADLADAVHDLAPRRRLEVAQALDVERLADMLEELPESDQVEILSGLDTDRAVEVLQAMQPDDAADLLLDLRPQEAERLLGLMNPDEAEDMRRLLSYDENTAGGMMTTQPVILPPDATVAEALAHVRRVDLTPALAVAAFVCRPPLETPTGRYLGLVHIQQMLREPPNTALGDVLDQHVEALDPTASLETITRHLATYNLISVPVTDETGCLVGAVTVDDVLDHLLPDDWRGRHD
ncbi:MAG: magnesium transporter MgtE N-terminal domain-containing protein [Acidimicrobiales bacterium]